MKRTKEWAGHKESLVMWFEECQFKSQYVDCTIFIGGSHFQAHKIILLNSSEYLKERLEEAGDQEYPIISVEENISRDVGRYLLNFMYRGKVSVPIQYREEFKRAASILRMHGIRQPSTAPAETEPSVSDETHSNNITSTIPTSNCERGNSSPSESICSNDISSTLLKNASQTGNSSAAQNRLSPGPSVTTGVTKTVSDHPALRRMPPNNRSPSLSLNKNQRGNLSDRSVLRRVPPNDTSPSMVFDKNQKGNQTSQTHATQDRLSPRPSVTKTGSVVSIVEDIPEELKWYQHITFSPTNSSGKPSVCEVSCKRCDAKFNDVLSLKKHVQDAHIKLTGTGVNKLRCTQCDIRFPRYSPYKNHMDSIHPFMRRVEIYTDSSKTSVKCYGCSKQFFRRMNYIKHLARVHGIVENNANEIFSILKLDKNSRDVSNKLGSPASDYSDSSNSSDNECSLNLQHQEIVAPPAEPMELDEPKQNLPTGDSASQSIQNNTTVQATHPIRSKLLYFCRFCESTKFNFINHLNNHMLAHAPNLVNRELVGHNSSNEKLYWCAHCSEVSFRPESHSKVCKHGLNSKMITV